MGKGFLGAEFVPNLSSLEPKIGHERLAGGRDRDDRYLCGKVHRDRDLPGEQDSYQKLRPRTRSLSQTFSSELYPCNRTPLKTSKRTNLG